MLLSLLAAVLIALLLRWPLLHVPLERDEGAYATVATLWRQGAVPYRDVWDHKPPLIYLLYRLLPLGGATSAWTLRTWGTAYFMLGLLLVYWIGRQLWDRPTATVATLLYAVAGSAFVLQGLVLNTEQALVVPALAALWCLLRWIEAGRWQAAIWLGVSLAAVALIKPTAVPLLLPLLLLGWRRQPLLVSAVALTGGAVIVILPFAFYLLLQRAWQAMIFALITYNGRYLRVSQGQWSTAELANMAAPFAPLALAALGGLALALPTGRRIDGKTRQRLALVGWTFAFAIAALASLRAYIHYYYPMLPGLALLAAPTLLWLVRQPHGSGYLQRVAHWTAPLSLLALLLVPLVTGNLRAGSQTPAEQSVSLYSDDGQLFADAERVAAYIQAHSAPSTRLFIWASEPEIYVLAQRQPASRYVYDYPLVLFPELGGGLQTELQRTPPGIVVVYAGAYPSGFDQVVTRRGLVRLTQIGHFEIFG